ncbi:MAG: hypothetical protein RR235_08005 [Oscillospiraceae bacterium]
MPNNPTDANRFYESLRPMLKASIKEQTKDCIRSKKLNVTTAPSGGLIGLTEPFGSKEIFIPYSSALQSVAAGASVRVVWFGNDMSTAVALWTGNVV